MTQLTDLARDLAEKLDANHGFNGHDPAMTQVLATGEEAGEFIGAYRRWIGAARRVGTFEEMAAEAADVAIVIHVACHYLGIDIEDAVARKAEKIFSRGWKDGVPNG